MKILTKVSFQHSNSLTQLKSDQFTLTRLDKLLKKAHQQYIEQNCEKITELIYINSIPPDQCYVGLSLHGKEEHCSK